MIKKKILAITFTLLLVFAGCSFILHQYIVDISRPYPEMQVNESVVSPVGQDTVHIGVISRFPSNILYQGYQPLMDYLTRETEYYFELVISRSYQETVNQLAAGKVDAAFLGSYIYLNSREAFGLFPILKPLNENGQPFFYSVLITREDAPIQGISDLKGKRLAMPSEQSFSANWLPAYGLGKYGLTVDDLGGLAFLQHHHTVVYEIMRNNFDAGSIKDRVALEFENRGIRIIAKSDPVPGSPLVVSTFINENIKKAIIEALLRIDVQQPVYQELVREWDPEFKYGFARAHPEDYDKMELSLGRTGYP